MTAIRLLLLARKYWPVIQLVLRLIQNNEGVLKDLLDRPETGPVEDARDLFRDIDRRNDWDPFRKEWE